MFTKVFTMSIICMLMCAANLLGATCEGYQIAIPDNGDNRDYRPRLIFPDDTTYRYAAKFLETYIQKSTGEQLAIVFESQVSPDKRVIYVGMTNFARQHVKFNSLKPEELVIKPAGKHLIICGEVHNGHDRGTLFGVYEYLERQLDIRWYYPKLRGSDFSDGIVIPKNKSITFPQDEIRSYPHFRMREGGVSYQFDPKDKEAWHPVLRFGNSLPHERANHTQAGWGDLYLNSNPEYFAVTNSSLKPRDPTQHCLTNKGFFGQLIENIATYDKNQEPKKAWSNGLYPTDSCVFFGLNDGFKWNSRCKCQSCAKLYGNQNDTEGFASKYVFSFIAKYANEISISKNRRLATIAYGPYSNPPDNIAIPNNVDITYVKPKIHFGYSTKYYAKYLARTQKWSTLLGGDKKRLTLWMNIVEPLFFSAETSYVPMMYPNILQKWLLKTKDLVSGYFINGYNPYKNGNDRTKSQIGTIQSFPMIYIQSRLLWKPDANVEGMLKEFCDNLYGPASNDMLEFYNQLIRCWEKADDNSDFEDTPPNLKGAIHHQKFPKSEITALRGKLNEAFNRSTGNYQTRIAYLRDRVYHHFFQESDNVHNNR